MELNGEKFVEVHVHYNLLFVFLKSCKILLSKLSTNTSVLILTNILTFHQLQISTNTAEDNVCPLGSVVTHSDQMYAASHTLGMSETQNKE